MTDNIYLVLGIQSREDCISNMLSYSINHSHSFRDGFLQYVCGVDSGHYSAVKAFTRTSLGAPGVPDLVVVLESAGGAKIVVIENKLKAEEGIDQTKRYACQESKDMLRKRFLPKRADVATSFVFLTLFPDQKPTDKFNAWSVMRHSDLTKFAGTVTNWDDSLSEQLVKDWVALTNQFYSRQTVNPQDFFLQQLEDKQGLDGGYLYFRESLGQLNLPAPLKIEELFRSSQQGRRYYGAIISKDDWHPSEMTELSNPELPNGWSLDPEKCYNIHFEPQYNILSKLFSCFLHYETNPYKTEAWVKDYRNLPQLQYEAYLRRRKSFSKMLQDEMANAQSQSWSFAGGRSNQVAKAVFQLDDKSTFADVKAHLDALIKPATITIDKVLGSLDKASP